MKRYVEEKQSEEGRVNYTSTFSEHSSFLLKSQFIKLSAYRKTEALPKLTYKRIHYLL